MEGSQGLILEIFRHDAGLKMSLYQPGEFASTLRHYSLCPVDFPEISRLAQEMVVILNKANKSGLLEPDLIQRLKKTGLMLWGHLLSRTIKERLKNTPCQGLALLIDEELVNLPWELLYDGNNFLCLNFNLGRLVRARGEFGSSRYRGWASVLKMLVLANPTNDLKSAYLEGLNIKNQFGRKTHNVRVDFKSSFIDKSYLKKNLCDYDLVHFAGHCEFDADNPKDTGWVLNDGKFTTRDILNMGDTSAMPALVFSNACYSAKVNADFIDMDYQQKSYSLASAFLFSGVRHYIGAIRRLEDPASFIFARDFYAQLLSGKSVGEALRLSRLGLVKELGIGAIPWASYLLYGDPNFAFFRKKEKISAVGAQRKVIFAARGAFYALAATGIFALLLYLYIRLPSINPNTYYLYLQAKNNFSQGKSGVAIAAAKRIIQREPLFLAAYPLLGDAYWRLGYPNSALKYYYDYALYSEKKQDQNNLASAYIKIGWFYQMRGGYEKAFGFYHKAIYLSRKAKDKLNEAAGLRKLAVWYIDKKDYARALELLTKSSEINRARQNIPEYRYNLACDYFDIGLVFANKNDFAAAGEFYRKSLRLFEAMKLKNELSDYYFNLGEICFFEKEFQKALGLYLKGLAVDEEQNNKMNLASDYSMIGELYVEMDGLKEAEIYFQKAIKISQEIDAPLELAGAYRNLGLLYKKLGKKNKARETLRLAQEIYRSIDISSYEEIKQELLL